MSRMQELEARRRILLARCELQREEMAGRLGELKNDPVRRVLAGLLGSPAAASGSASLKHPLVWVVAIAGLFFLRRPRQLLTVLGLARSALSMGARASLALRVLGQVRSVFSRSARPEKRP